MTGITTKPSEEILQRARRPENPEEHVLGDEARALFETLPEPVRPSELMRQYPRSANRIAANWDRPTDAMREFADLLIDHRGNRRGFPVAVALEIYALHDYYVSEVSPQVRSVWEDVDRTRQRA